MTPIIRITKHFEFEAAHNLPNHDGECRGLHGHSYKVAVTIQGPAKPKTGGPDEGMVIDFKHLKEVYRTQVHEKLDHKYLNEVPGLDGLPTAERIAMWILCVFMRHLDNTVSNVLVYSVEVHETRTSSATVFSPLAIAEAAR